MCGRTAEEIAADNARQGVALVAIPLTRQRPLIRSTSEYQICLECAREVKSTQEQRSKQPAHVLPGIAHRGAPTVSSSRQKNAPPGSTRNSAEDDLFPSKVAG
jgi:hypothetical protein